MNDRPRLWLCWSSGKDSAWSLHILRRNNEYDVVGLLTTIDEDRRRVAMHDVHLDLLRRQADAVGLPLRIVPIPHRCSNDAYDAAMRSAVGDALAQGVRYMAFGDLFLDDIRAYRESRLAGSGIEPIFPLWGLPTDRLIRDMIAAGQRALVTSVDPRALPASFAGRELDASFIADLPEGVDPCGERGEYHTFVFDGPAFNAPISIAPGEPIERDGFIYADLLPSVDLP